MKNATHEIALPSDLQSDTANLVCRFAEALGAKLRTAEKKHGYDNGWMSDDWQFDCMEAMLHHIQKGDPRDVAAYCAFMWHHSWRTSMQVQSVIVP